MPWTKAGGLAPHRDPKTVNNRTFEGMLQGSWGR